MLLRPGGFAVRGDNTIGASKPMQPVGIYTTPAALGSQQVVHANAFHAQLEAISLMELLGTAEVCGELASPSSACTSCTSPAGSLNPIANSRRRRCGMRSTPKDFTVRWRRTPGPTPRLMDLGDPISTGSMRRQLHLGVTDLIRGTFEPTLRYPCRS